MRTKTFSAKRLLSLVLTIAMFATMILPTSVFAVPADPTAVASAVDNGDGTVTRKITISFGEKIDATGALLGSTVYVDGKADAFGGEGSSMAIDPDTETDIIITIGTDYTAVVGDKITFTTDCIKYVSDDSYYNGDVEITGSFDAPLADFEALNEAIEDAEAVAQENYTAPTVEALKIALEAAKAIDQTTVTNQTTVNEATNNLATAIGNLLELADFTELNEAIEAAEEIEIENYTATTVGEFNTAYDAANAIDQTTTSVNEQGAVDTATENLNDSINKLVPLANFAALNEAIEQAGNIDSDDYTAASIAVLEDAITAANNIDQTEESVQATVDDAKDAILTAIANLVGFTDVTFTATAVADNVSADYGKANKIIVVFGKPLKDGSENVLADKVNVDATVSKVNNSVYVFELDADQDLSNGMTFTIVPEEEIFAADGKAINDCSATVVGNLESAAELVTADEMTATIVNIDDKPYMVNGDKIVLVFNAPVYGNPDTITVSEMEFAVVAGTDNTIYERELVAATDSVAAGQTLSFVDDKNTTISAMLKGTFGGTVVPVVVRALIEDVDGTAKTAGDKINVFFNAPTNKVAGAEETNFEGVLAGAEGKWLDNQTLVITLGNTAITVNDKIDLSNLGIKDFYGTEDADADEIALEGSFGVAIQPKLLTVTAISKSGAGTAAKGDEIHLSFNVKMKEDDLDIIDDFDFDNGNYGSEGATVAWATGEEYADYSTIIITLGEEPQVVPGETVISIKKVLYEETGIKACDRVALQNRKVAGTFGTTVAPELLSASIVKTKPVVGPQNGDQIVLLFNVPTNGKNIDNLIKVGSKSLGTGYEGNWNNDFTVYTIELGSTPTVAGGDTIEFDNDGTLKDINGQKQARSNSVTISGSFGEEATPVGISPSKVTATIVKATTIAGPQAEDKIVFAFNVATNGSEDLMEDFFNAQGNKFGNGLRGSWNDSKTIYTLYLGSGATVSDGETITFTTQAGIQDKDSINAPVTLTCTLIGSFGVEITPVTVAPTLLDAVIIKGSNTVGATKGDKIQLIFNMAINNADLYAELGGVNVFGAESNGAKDNNIYTITIGDNANIPANFNITAAAGLKDAAEFSEAAVIPNIVLTGSFGDEIKPVTAAPTLFKAVIVKATDTVGPQAGDKIQLVFNMAINDADLFEALGGAAVFGTDSYGSADSNVYTITLGTGITSIPTTFSINSDAGLKDASGYSANAVITNFTLVGSFGIVVNPVATKPALKNAVIVKDSGKLGINAGDKIVLIFNVATNGKDDNINLLNNIAFPGRNNETLGESPSGRWISDIEYEITLGEGASISESVSENAIIKFNHHDKLMDKAKITAAGEIEIYKFEGTFGESIAPVAISAVAFSDDGVDYIEVLFNVAVERLDDGVMIFENNNNFLGTEPYGEWMADNLYRITLDDNYTIKNTNLLHFNDAYTIYAKNGTAAMAAGSAIAVTGELRKPMVTEVYAGTKVVNGDDITYEAAETITIVFSSKTNGGEIDLSAQSSLLGIGATATWNDAKTELTIALGTDRKLSAGSGYILLNGLGITNGFDNNEVVGQYSISAGILPEDELETDLIRVNTRGDNNNYMTVIFNAPTNMYGKTLATEFNMSDIEANIEATHTFGDGATAEWESASKLVIKLGAGSTFKNEKSVAENSTVTFKNLKFANGLGSIKVEAEKVTGSFDGRETKLEGLTAKVEGDYTVATVTLNKQDLDFGKNVEPEGDEEVDNFDVIVTFVIWDKDGKLVTDMNSMNIDVNAVDKIELQSKFATKEAGKVDVYVTDTYIDAITEGTPTFDLLADTVTSSVAAQ